jgi:hypothetical protein
MGPIASTETDFHALCGSLIERYGRSDLGIHMHLSVNDGKWPELCIAIENLNGTCGVVNPNLAVLDNKVFLRNSGGHETCEQYPSVLIDIREFIHGPEDTLAEILPQMVRLQTLDFCNRVWGHPVKAMPLNLVVEKFNSATNGEHIFSTGLIVRSKYKFPYQIVEGRTEILENISDNQSKASGNGTIGNEAKESLILGSVRLSHHFAWIALKVALKLRFQRLDVLCRPEDFQFDGIKRGHDTASYIGRVRLLLIERIAFEANRGIGLFLPTFSRHKKKTAGTFRCPP